MPLATRAPQPRRRPIAVRHVADLVLAASTSSASARSRSSRRATSTQSQSPRPCELARERRADAARGARATRRLLAHAHVTARRHRAAGDVARDSRAGRACPSSRSCGFQSLNECPRRRLSSSRCSSSRHELRTVLAAPSSSRRRSRAASSLRRHAFVRRQSQSTVGLVTTLIFTFWKRVFGMMLPPVVLTFFVSWKSEATNVACFFAYAAVIAGACGRDRKSTTPVAGSYAAAPSRTLVVADHERERVDARTSRPSRSRRCVGRPAATRFVSSLSAGGLRSLIQRPEHVRAGERCAGEGSLPESTAT